MARSWRVTVRRGPDVERLRAASLDEALDEVRRQVDATLAAGGLDSVSMLRDFEPGDRVQARIELSGPGFLRGAEGGIDVMGDGSLVAYRGAIGKTALDASSLDEALAGLREGLAGDG